MKKTKLRLIINTILSFLVFAGYHSFGQSPSENSKVFLKTNLVAWCIVPFDNKKRGPEERVQMLVKLGITKMASDPQALPYKFNETPPKEIRTKNADSLSARQFFHLRTLSK